MKFCAHANTFPRIWEAERAPREARFARKAEGDEVMELWSYEVMKLIALGFAERISEKLFRAAKRKEPS